MANSKGPSTIRNMVYSGKHTLLPPKIPFPNIAPPYADFVPAPATGQKFITKYKEGNSHHQRTSSESILIEEQPSWLDELLDEPETPVRRGHRRSSSDSFAYLDIATAANVDCAALDNFKFNNLASVPMWGSQDFSHYKDGVNAAFYGKGNSMLKHKNQAWDSSPNSNFVLQPSAPMSLSQVVDGVPSTTTEKQDSIDSGTRDGKASLERKDSYAKGSASETDSKHAKQQFAQRSRVRKLQYIAELERNVQVLQAEGSEVSAELEFLNQQSLILSMENQALKQRLESLAQEQLIKYMEHEVLEREIGRLRALYQQQQQPQPQPLASHRRSKSRDQRDQLDLKFANLPLKNKDSTPPRDPVSGSLHS